MTKQIILRHPGGIATFETDNPDLIKSFIAWILTTNHFSCHAENEKENAFTFDKSSYVSACNVKWKKLCSNMS